MEEGFTRDIESMRRRYGRCEEVRSPRVSWFILFFLMVAIFFFNYFGKKLGGPSPPMPQDLVLFSPNGTPVIFRPSEELTVLTFVSSGCEPCRKQVEDLKALAGKGWVVPVVVYVDSRFDPEKDGYIAGHTYTLHPKELKRVVEVMGVDRVPFTLIIDSGGLVRRSIKGYVPYDTLVSYIKVIRRYGI